jgi:predicted acyltransferase
MDSTLLLSAHNILRWAVLLFGLYAITKSARGYFLKQDYTPNHNLSATLFIASVHLQVVLGLLLYVARNWASQISMSNAVQRFWGVEHIFGMLLAAVLIQIGRSKSKKQQNVPQKHKTALLFFAIGFVLILATIPWPFRGEVARALWP